MRIGYARVSTVDQNPELQIDALKAADVEDIVTEYASGKNRERPALEATLARLGEGDTLVVWKLDRLGRSLADLVNIIKELEQAGVQFQCLTEAIDTSTNGGRLVFHIMGALAEYERNLIRERILAGKANAKRKGVHQGAHFKLDDDDLDLLLELWPTTPVSKLAAKWKVERTTIYRAHQRALARQK